MTETPTQLAGREARRAATDFNLKFRPGSPVLAWPGTRDEEPIRTRTRGSAWVLSSGEPLVSVIGHAGGIALTHINPDPTRQPAVPDVEFSCPPCPICDHELDTDGDSLVCNECGASWADDGRYGTWHDPDTVRCLATRQVDPDSSVDQCVLAQDHKVGRIVDAGSHRDDLGFAWVDGDRWALTDTQGETL